jgi:hypothetical protein
MIRRLSRVTSWLLLLAVMMLSPGYSDAQDNSCSDNWCRYLIPDSDPATYVYNNLWNTRGARGSQSITLYGSTSNDIWSTTWDWKRRPGYQVTSYASTVSGWHWGEPFETQGVIPSPDPVSAGTPVRSTVQYQYEPDATCNGTGKRAIICRYDVAYDLWFHATENPGPSSAPVFELMVWLSYSWDDLWIGYTPVDIVEIPLGSGTKWKIFQTARQTPCSSPPRGFQI